uniref:Uncharacterized protein n=1 Tax=Arundo donax TaxID=35708 RepID=A0A0A9BSA3_ARUDO
MLWILSQFSVKKTFIFFQFLIFHINCLFRHSTQKYRIHSKLLSILLRDQGFTSMFSPC